MTEPVVLKSLLKERHWQSYPAFCAQYDKAARTVDKRLVGKYPSRAQLHRWTNGLLKGLPYADHCQVLEAMFPGVRAAEMFEPASENGAEQPSAEQTLGDLVQAGLQAPATELGSWSADRLAPPRARTNGATVGLPSAGNGHEETSDQLAQAIALLGKRLRLSEAEVTELAKLAGHLVDLELECTIDIDADGLSTITYRFEMVNLTNKAIKRMSREQWFENTDGRLRIEPHPSSDRQVRIQRVHDTANMTKFDCVFSPAIEPGEVATIAYTSAGGLFLHDHYWRQTAPRYTRHFTLSIRHRGADMLLNCTAVVDGHDGHQHSAIDDLVCSDGDGDALMTVTRDYLQPSDSVTIRWEVSRGAAQPG